MRLIDADKLKEQIKAKTQHFFSDGRWPQECIENEIDSAPTVHHAEKWIRVDDRLPEENNAVLVYNGNVREGYADVLTLLHDSEGQYWEDPIGYLYGVDEATHWMPLPEPPKEVLS